MVTSSLSTELLAEDDAVQLKRIQTRAFDEQN
jgi:hypothetical protein